MINYARERATAILQTALTAVLATTGPAGVQVGEFPCEAAELDLYLLLPKTSDHLFNLEQDGRLALHTDQWELTGRGQAVLPEQALPRISRLAKAGTRWFTLVKVAPERINVLRDDGWGSTETIDLTQFR